MARNTRAKIVDDNENGSVRFEFNDGGEPLVARLADFPHDIQRRLAVKALHNKMMDSYADLSTNPRHEATGVYEMLKSGTWSERGEGVPQQSLLAEAIVAVVAKAGKTITQEQALEKADSMSKEQRAAFRKRPDIAAELGRLEAERKAARAAKLAEAAKNATISAEADPLADLLADDESEEE